MQSVSINALIAIFQFSSAASLNLEWFQNDLLGNGLIGCLQMLSVWTRLKFRCLVNVLSTTQLGVDNFEDT